MAEGQIQKEVVRAPGKSEISRDPGSQFKSGQQLQPEPKGSGFLFIRLSESLRYGRIFWKKRGRDS